MDRDWEACLTFYSFPEAHGARIRTTNVIERLFLEIKKRSKKMSAAVRNEGSCLLLFFAVVRGMKHEVSKRGHAGLVIGTAAFYAQLDKRPFLESVAFPVSLTVS